MPHTGGSLSGPLVFAVLAMVLLFGMLMIQQKRRGRRTFDVTPREVLLGLGLGFLFFVCSALVFSRIM